MREGAAERFRAVIADPDQRLIVAEDPDGLAGMVLCSIGTSSTLATAPAVVLSHLTVAANSRRAGVGRVLVAAATQWAAECDVDHLRVAVYASSREANRFFARLGFAPVSVNRVAPVAALRRILGAEVPAAEADSGDGARRRRLRLGITGGGSRSTAPAAAPRLRLGSRVEVRQPDVALRDEPPCFVGDQHLPELQGASAVQRGRDDAQRAFADGAQEARRVADPDDAAVRHPLQLPDGAGEARDGFGDGGVDAAVHDAVGLQQPVVDRDVTADACRACARRSSAAAGR